MLVEAYRDRPTFEQSPTINHDSGAGWHDNGGPNSTSTLNTASALADERCKSMETLPTSAATCSSCHPLPMDGRPLANT